MMWYNVCRYKQIQTYKNLKFRSSFQFFDLDYEHHWCFVPCLISKKHTSITPLLLHLLASCNKIMSKKQEKQVFLHLLMSFCWLGLRTSLMFCSLLTQQETHINYTIPWCFVPCQQETCKQETHIMQSPYTLQAGIIKLLLPATKSWARNKFLLMSFCWLGYRTMLHFCFNSNWAKDERNTTKSWARHKKNKFSLHLLMSFCWLGCRSLLPATKSWARNKKNKFFFSYSCHFVD